jgi:hypothetical protein
MLINYQEGRTTAQATRTSAEVALSMSTAAEFARKVGHRRRTSGAPVRKGFVSTVFYAGGTATPSLAAMLRGGGRGGQLRVKLYISLLWLCAAAPYEASLPARAWAALLGLADHETRGVRRIHEAIRDLHDRKLITVRDRGGMPSILGLLDENGGGEPYIPPSTAYNTLARQNAAPAQLRRHQYFRIPSSFWTEGYVSQLGGPGVAMLLVLLCEQPRAGAGIWFTPETARQRFALAHSTRATGLQQLRELGLVTSQVAVTSEDGTYLTFQRRRNVHQLNLGAEGSAELPANLRSLFK